MGLPGGSVVKNPPTKAGDPGSIPRVGRSLGEENGNSTPAFLPGKFHGQSSQVGYSPWGCKELDTTEHTQTHGVLFHHIKERTLFHAAKTLCQV